MRYIISATLALGAIACSTPAADPPAAVRDAAQAVGNVLDSWKKKLDDPSAKPDSVSLSAERDAISITSGPAGIYYKSDMKAEKDYTASATFSELKATPQPVEYGLFVAGTNLDKDTAHYTALLVRADGKYRIVSVDGGTQKTIVDWTTAGPMMEPKGAKTSNTLTIRALQDGLHFLINDKELHQMPRLEAGEDGVAGVRVGPGLSVQVSKLDVKKFP